MATIACQRSPTQIETPDQPVVIHAMLMGGSDSVEVIVARANPETDFGLPFPVAITNASVRLVRGSDAIVLTNGGSCIGMSPSGEGPANFAGCYSAHVPGGIRNGERYDLEVVVPGEPLITGSTIVPPAFTLLSPGAGDSIDVLVQGETLFEPFTIAWAGIDQARTVHLQVDIDTSSCVVRLRRPTDLDLGFEMLFAAAASEAPTVYASLFNCSDEPSRLSARLVATLFDEGYEKYMRGQGSTMRPDEASIGLEGGFGVFGSAAQASQPVALVRN